MHLLQDFLRHAFGDQVFEDQFDFPFAADHADVSSVRGRQVIEGFLVVGVPSGHDKAIGGRANVPANDLAERAADVPHQEALRRRKPFPAGIAFTIVEDPNFKIDICRHSGHRLADVAAADNE